MFMQQMLTRSDRDNVYRLFNRKSKERLFFFFTHYLCGYLCICQKYLSWLSFKEMKRLFHYSAWDALSTNFGSEKCFCLSVGSAAHLAELETTCHLRLLRSPWQSGANDLEGYTVPLHMASLPVWACVLCMGVSAHGRIPNSSPTNAFSICVRAYVYSVNVHLHWCFCVSVWVVAWDLFSSAWRVSVHLGLWSSLLAE